MSHKMRSYNFDFLFQKFHGELIAKEPLVSGLRKKAQKLLSNKDVTPSMKAVKKNIKQLGN